MRPRSPMAGGTESGLVTSNALVSVSTLLLLQYVAYSIAIGSPSISFTPIALRIKSDDGSSMQTNVECIINVPNQIRWLNISRKADKKAGEGESAEICLISADERAREPALNDILSAEYERSGIGLGIGGQTSSITLVMKKPKCDDAGKYTCSAKYKLPDGTDAMTRTDAYLETYPYDFMVTRTAANESIKVGDKITLTCEGKLGTLKNDDIIGGSELTWVARNRETANSNEYNDLEENLVSSLRSQKISDVGCTELWQVTLALTVHKVRDSKRDYYCVVDRNKASKGKVIHTGPTGGNNSIAMPNFEEKAKTPIGVGGFVGIGLGAMALLSGGIFGLVWCLRRGKKKNERSKEIESRKSLIDERRKSISTIVERRRSMMTVEPDAESSMVESSAVESSVVESSAAESSVAEPSTAGDETSTA